MFILIHYSEIGLKGDNRDFFENKLIENIKISVNCKVNRMQGRILIETSDKKAMEKLKYIFGIHSFSHCIITDLNESNINKIALSLLKKSKKKSDKKSFRVTVQRQNKAFPKTSMDLARDVGAYIWRKTKKKVDLHNPDETIYIEIANKAIIYKDKFEGPGGLPVGTAGKIVCLISGGIDSPVAAYMLMKRGCEVVFVHFHNYMSDIDKKIEKLCIELKKYQPKIKLYLVPFFPIQEHIISKIDAKYRMIVYKRYMIRIANEIAKKEDAKAIATGDSVAQVASQTLDNIQTIYSASELPILPSLIGFDKNETINLAKKIGTFDISIQKYQDCCTYMIAKHPATHSKIKEVEKMEKKLKKSVIKEAVKKAEIKEL